MGDSVVRLNTPSRPAGRSDIARAFAHLAGSGEASADPIAAMRAQVDAYGDVDPRAPLTGVELRPVSADGVNAEWVLPLGGAARFDSRIVYLHGGGWVAGGLESHRPIAAHLARRAGCPVLLVDYRLAPEHPFPAAFDDCVMAFSWAARFGPDGEAPCANLLLAGDSAGANLAAATTLSAIQASARVADRLVLLSPPLDGSANPARGEAAGLNGDHAALEAVMSLYLQGATGLDDPRVSPLRATDALLGAFPPTLIQVSGAEFLLWDAQELTRRLIACDVRAHLSVWPGLPHVWQAFLSLLPEASEALDEAVAFLTASLRAQTRT
jgi:monoterpene epsilon-lactone hydrolase